MVQRFKNTMQSNCYISHNNLKKLIYPFPFIGFSGSRHKTSNAYYSATAFLDTINNYSGKVGVGCAAGVDYQVRSQFPNAKVFRVQPPINRSAFAFRSARLVEWVSASSGLLIVFPATVCPTKVFPSPIFYGHGSGSWGSAAYAVGLGTPVLLFIHVYLGNHFPAPLAFASKFKCLGSHFNGSWWMSV